MDLHGQHALVTGASRGVGRAIARVLAQAGARVTLSARPGPALEEAVRALQADGHAVVGRSADLTLEPDIARLAEAVAADPSGLDILVNNAGVAAFRPAAELCTADWDHMFAVNVRAPFLLTRYVLPLLRRSESGAVVNVVSLAGKHAFAGGAAYAATKHALLAFSRCLMLEERANGIRVASVCPGTIETGFPRPAAADRSGNRALQAGDVAAAVLYILTQPAGVLVDEIDLRPARP